jgi:hypothetical protein
MCSSVAPPGTFLEWFSKFNQALAAGNGAVRNYLRRNAQLLPEHIVFSKKRKHPVSRPRDRASKPHKQTRSNFELLNALSAFMKSHTPPFQERKTRPEAVGFGALWPNEYPATAFTLAAHRIGRAPGF